MSEVSCWRCFPVGRGSNRFWNKKGHELKAIAQAEARMLSDEVEAGKEVKLATVRDDGVSMAEMLEENLVGRRAQAAKKRVAAPSGPKMKKRTSLAGVAEPKAATPAAPPVVVSAAAESAES